jgi:hypothetical protein
VPNFQNRKKSNLLPGLLFQEESFLNSPFFRRAVWENSTVVSFLNSSVTDFRNDKSALFPNFNHQVE